MPIPFSIELCARNHRTLAAVRRIEVTEWVEFLEAPVSGHMAPIFTVIELLESPTALSTGQSTPAFRLDGT